jgi:ankyrin repeat protein
MSFFKRPPTWGIVMFDTANEIYESIDYPDVMDLVLYESTEIMREVLDVGPWNPTIDKKHPILECNPIQYVVRKGWLRKLLVLIEKGADLGVRDEMGQTCLHLATVYLTGRVEIVNVLLSHGADPSARDRGGRTPLTVAARHGYVMIVDTLLQNGSDVNAVENCGLTAIHWAAHMGHTEVVRMLIQHGANILAVLHDGRTVVDMANANEHMELAAMLKAEIVRRAR